MKQKTSRILGNDATLLRWGRHVVEDQIIIYGLPAQLADDNTLPPVYKVGHSNDGSACVRITRRTAQKEFSRRMKVCSAQRHTVIAAILWP
jgi:hypothetical protein